MGFSGGSGKSMGYGYFGTSSSFWFICPYDRLRADHTNKIPPKNAAQNGPKTGTSRPKMQDEPVEDEQVDDEHSFHRTNFFLNDPRYGKVYKELYKTPQLQNLLLELNQK